MTKRLFFFTLMTVGNALFTAFTITDSASTMDPNASMSAVIYVKAEEREMEVYNLIKTATNTKISVEQALARIEQASNSTDEEDSKIEFGGEE